MTSVSWCTIGKNGRKYCFTEGKRVTCGGATLCGKGRATAAASPKKQTKPRPAKPQTKQSKTIYVWRISEMLIPVDRSLSVPIHRVWEGPAEEGIPQRVIDQNGIDNLAVVDKSLDKAFSSFEDQRVGWGPQQWDFFIQSVFPVWLVKMQAMQNLSQKVMNGEGMPKPRKRITRRKRKD